MLLVKHSSHTTGPQIPASPQTDLWTRCDGWPYLELRERQIAAGNCNVRRMPSGQLPEPFSPSIDICLITLSFDALLLLVKLLFFIRARIETKAGCRGLAMLGGSIGVCVHCLPSAVNIWCHYHYSALITVVNYVFAADPCCSL